MERSAFGPSVWVCVSEMNKKSLPALMNRISSFSHAEAAGKPVRQSNTSPLNQNERFSGTTEADQRAGKSFTKTDCRFCSSSESRSRIKRHTHTGSCPRPNAVDCRTFSRCFGRCDWAVMFILARDDSTSAELDWRQGPAHLPLRVDINYSRPFPATDFAGWEQEYCDCVKE